MDYWAKVFSGLSIWDLCLKREQSPNTHCLGAWSWIASKAGEYDDVGPGGSSEAS